MMEAPKEQWEKNISRRAENVTFPGHHYIVQHTSYHTEKKLGI